MSCSAEEKCLTRSGNIFKRCTEDIEELLNPTNTASVEEVESEDSPLPLSGVAEVVKTRRE